MIDKYNLKEKTVLVFDFGSQIAVAQRLSRDFGRVLYYIPSVINGFKDHKAHTIGRGVPGIERVDDFWQYFHDIDLFVFTDIYEGPMQDYLRAVGKPVFGGGRGSELESERLKFKELIKSLKLPINEYQSAEGLSELESILMQVEGRYIKSKLRGDMETWHHENHTLSQTELRRMKHDMGVYAEQETYIIESPIDAIGEIGYDGYCVDGEFPEISCCGIEVKDCYDDKTEVLTNEGWKLFKDLNKKEKVFTLNINSEDKYIKSEFQYPTDYIDREYNGQLVSIEKDSVSLMITPTHNILVQDGVINEESEEVEWESKERGVGCGTIRKFKRGKQVIRLQKAIDVINRNKRFSLFQPKPKLCLDNNQSNYIKIGELNIPKSKFASLIGLFLSEGYVRKRGNNYEINISQYKYVDQFEKIISLNPFKFNKVKNGFNCYDKLLGEYLLQFGNARDKFIPEWIKSSGKDVINSFLDAYCLGDGTFSFNYKKIRKDSPIYNENFTHKKLVSRYFYTASKRMSDDLQELLVKIGSVAVSRIDKYYFNETLKQEFPMYGVQEKLINRKNYIFPSDVSYVDYSGRVFCVTVPNGIIMIRRNGKSMWCGNCGYIGKMIRYDRLPKQIKSVNEKFAPILKTYDYRAAFSTEIRVDEKKEGYFIDPTLRFPEPNTALTLEMYDNYSEIIWDVANGKVPNIKWTYEWGCEFIIKSELGKTEPVAFQFPDKYKKYIKFKNLVVDDKGVHWYTPNNVEMAEVGAVIGLGRTMDQAVKMATEIAETIKCFDIKIKTDCIEDANKQIKDLRKNGINFL